MSKFSEFEEIMQNENAKFDVLDTIDKVFDCAKKHDDEESQLELRDVFLRCVQVFENYFENHMKCYKSPSGKNCVYVLLDQCILVTERRVKFIYHGHSLELIWNEDDNFVRGEVRAYRDAQKFICHFDENDFFLECFDSYQANGSYGVGLPSAPLGFTITP